MREADIFTTEPAVLPFLSGGLFVQEPCTRKLRASVFAGVTGDTSPVSAEKGMNTKIRCQHVSRSTLAWHVHMLSSLCSPGTLLINYLTLT